MTDNLDALVEATRETHPPREPITHGSDSLATAATRLREEHGLDGPRPSSNPNTISSPNYPRRRAIFALGVVAAGLLTLGGGYGLYVTFSDSVDAQVERNQQIREAYENQPQDGIGYINDSEIEP